MRRKKKMIKIALFNIIPAVLYVSNYCFAVISMAAGHLPLFLRTLMTMPGW
jgi:hypothetical protein